VNVDCRVHKISWSNFGRLQGGSQSDPPGSGPQSPHSSRSVFYPTPFTLLLLPYSFYPTPFTLLLLLLKLRRQNQCRFKLLRFYSGPLFKTSNLCTELLLIYLIPINFFLAIIKRAHFLKVDYKQASLLYLWFSRARMFYLYPLTIVNSTTTNSATKFKKVGSGSVSWRGKIPL
jgi:hypothetical protein